MSDWDEPDTLAICRRVDTAFTAWRKLLTRLHRLKRPTAADVQAERDAEVAYRQASNERDEFVAIRRAQRTQGKISPIKLTPSLFPRGPVRDDK